MIDKPSPSLSQAAAAYARNGWYVFPLHNPTPEGGCSCGKPSCDNIGKHPRTPHGLKDASTDAATVQAWWRRWPDANIGLDCGRSGLVVIDVDADKGGLETWADFTTKHHLEQFTLKAKTGGGGLHILYKAPDGVSIGNSANKLGRGLDVRANGGYIILAPSLHRSGRRYEWFRD